MQFRFEFRQDRLDFSRIRLLLQNAFILQQSGRILAKAHVGVRQFTRDGQPFLLAANLPIRFLEDFKGLVVPRVGLGDDLEHLDRLKNLVAFFGREVVGEGDGDWRIDTPEACRSRCLVSSGEFIRLPGGPASSEKTSPFAKQIPGGRDQFSCIRFQQTAPWAGTKLPVGTIRRMGTGAEGRVAGEPVPHFCSHFFS